MKTFARWAAAVALVLVVAAPVAAQTSFRVVQSEDGGLWLLTGTERLAIFPEAISQEELEALPEGASLGAEILLPTPAPIARPALATAPLSLKGSGTQKTAPFALAGGTYKIRWTCTTSESSANCIGYLQSVARSRFSETSPDESELLFNELPRRGNTLTGETFAYGIKGGEYYISASGGATWTLNIEQVP